MPRSLPRLAIAAAVVAAGVLVPHTAQAATPTAATASAQGLAYGAAARLAHASLPDVSLGRVAPQVLPCLPRPGVAYQRRAASAQVPGVVRTGTVTDKGTVTASVSSDRVAVVESSTVEDVDLLDGVVRADAIVATARTALGPAGPVTTGTVSVVNLRVGTQVLDGAVPPNTVVPLPGVGELRLNEQRVVAGGAGIEVVAVHLALDSPTGYTGDVTIAFASSRLDGAGVPDAAVGGYAHVLSARVRPVVNVAALGSAGMPCAGTGGQWQTHVVATGFPPVLGSATGATGVRSDRQAGATASQATATVEDLVLLDGAVRAEAVTASASTTASDGQVTSRADGTRFVGLVVGGTPVDGEVPPNTTRALPGIGSVVLNAQACEGDGADPASCTGVRYDSITVTGLRVVVDTPNDLGLPVGATITVAVAHSEVAA